MSLSHLCYFPMELQVLCKRGEGVGVYAKVFWLYVNIKLLYVSRWIAVFLCFSLIALVFPISLVLVAAFSFDYADAPPPSDRSV